MGPIIAIRERSDADGKIRPANPDEKTEADKILAVSVTDADGKKFEFSSVQTSIVESPQRRTESALQQRSALDCLSR